MYNRYTLIDCVSTVTHITFKIQHFIVKYMPIYVVIHSNTFNAY